MPEEERELAAAPAGDFVNTIRVPLRGTPGSVRVARRITRLACERWDLAERSEAAELMVSELVAAALNGPDGATRPDAGTPLILRLSRLADALVIAVSSTNSTTSSTEDGLAEMLIDVVADAWGWLPLPDGHLVWARLTAA